MCFASYVRTYPNAHDDASERKQRIGSVIRVSSGNFLEMHDFMVLGYYAASGNSHNA